MRRPKISRRAETRPYERISAPTRNCRRFLTQLPCPPLSGPIGRVVPTVLTHILMLTRMAHHPVENSMFHGTRRFSRGSQRSAKRAEAHATHPHLFHQHRTQHRPLPAFIRPERTPLPSPSPRQSPINFVVSTTYTHIHRTQAIHYEK